MDKIEGKQHISKRFDDELGELRSFVLNMGGLVEQQLVDAINALSKVDSALAAQVIENDYKVNRFDVRIDERVTEILVRRQPTASDLRFVLAVIKTTADLERIGDEAKRIARMSSDLSDNTRLPSAMLQIRHLGSLVQEMLRNALDSFARTDVETAICVARQDDTVDQEYESIVRELMTHMMEDPRKIPATLEIMWSARALERIGDRCCNISEYLIYYVKGKDVRHITLEQLEEELKR